MLSVLDHAQIFSSTLSCAFDHGFLNKKQPVPLTVMPLSQCPLVYQAAHGYQKQSGNSFGQDLGGEREGMRSAFHMLAIDTEIEQYLFKNVLVCYRSCYRLKQG